MTWSVASLEDIPSAKTLTDDVSWLMACAAAEGGKSMVLRHGDVFLPLRVRKGSGLVVVEALGQNFRSVAGPIGVNGSGLPRLGREHLPERADLVDLRRLPKECLPGLFPESPGRVEHLDAVWFQRDLGNSTDEFLKSLATSTRKEYKYSTNRVEKTFGASNVRYRPVRIDRDNLEESWAEAVGITPYSWQGKSGVSVLTSETKKQFVRDLLHRDMTVYFHFYYLGKSLAAVAISMEMRGQFLIFSHEYNQDFARFRPGSLIDLKIISDALDRSVNMLDFGIGDTPNKRMLHCVPTELWRLLVPLTWKGWLAVAYLSGRRQVGKLLRLEKWLRPHAARMKAGLIQLSREV